MAVLGGKAHRGVPAPSSRGRIKKKMKTLTQDQTIADGKTREALECARAT